MSTLDRTFTAMLQKSPSKGGWTYVVLPGSAEYFDTRGRIRIRGRIEGRPFRGSFMALGDGTHKLAVPADPAGTDRKAGRRHCHRSPRRTHPTTRTPKEHR